MEYPEIYAFSGKIGSGKNFMAEKIFPEYLSSKSTLVMAFADVFKVRAIIEEGLDEKKVFEGPKDEETRRILQIYGTEEGRDKKGEDIWCRYLEQYIRLYSQRKSIERVIITDLRFENEANYLRSLGAYLIRVEAPNRNKSALEQEASNKDGNVQYDVYNKISQHPSETGLDNWTDWDLVIHNDYEDSPYIHIRDWVVNHRESKHFYSHVVLIDLDDTVVSCGQKYHEKIDKACDLIIKEKSKNLTKKQVKNTFKELDSDRLNSFYDRYRLSKKLKELGVYYNVSSSTLEKLYELGIQVYKDTFEYLSGSYEALNLLWKNLDNNDKLIIFTLGRREDQVRKIHELGLFDIEHEIVETRKSDDVYQQVKKDYPANKYTMIGDSLENDVYPALSADFNNIYWVNSYSNQSSLYDYFVVKDLQEAVYHFLNLKDKVT
jgi:phosphomevalonate kinase